MLIRQNPTVGTGFNTQPPEGGWTTLLFRIMYIMCFNTQPPEGGWTYTKPVHQLRQVSTHSRLKAAGSNSLTTRLLPYVSTHSRLKAAGSYLDKISSFANLFQHTAA